MKMSHISMVEAAVAQHMSANPKAATVRRPDTTYTYDAASVSLFEVPFQENRSFAGTLTDGEVKRRFEAMVTCGGTFCGRWLIA